MIDPPPDIDSRLADFDAWVRGGRTPEQAERALAAYLGPAGARLVRELHEERARPFIDAGNAAVLRGSPQIETWYRGPEFEGAWAWPAYRSLLVRRGWDESALGDLDQASSRILAHLPHPGTERFSTRGLVVGHVQSGKTASYSGVIAKAADAGYKLFVILAGTTSSLRQQTQRRIQGDICDAHSENWNRLTSIDQDFPRLPGNPDALLTPGNIQGRVLCVIKKNRFILERLINFLGRASPTVLSSCPTIILDDEADSASVNAGVGQRTAINRHIIQLLGLLPRCAYLGYTATPFANIFIDPSTPEDLFPRDFILALPRPPAYFGAERIFGRAPHRYEDPGGEREGADIVRTVPVDEIPDLVPAGANDRDQFQPAVPASLDEALRYFLLATACRYSRGQDGLHSTMLVHPSQYIVVHERLQGAVLEHLRRLRADLDRERDAYARVWDREAGRVGEPQETFHQLWPHLRTVIQRCEIVIDNGSEAGLTYEGAGPKVLVAIGGNTLSRGLTLEGLVVSYFVRNAAAYDTLLQMGRWFGYRPGYEDLPRIWMTDELASNFQFLALVEEEMRVDIHRMQNEGKKPTDFAIRIRTHPALQITAPARMGNARIDSASYSDRRVQTFLFDHEDGPALRRNLDAGRQLIEESRAVAGDVESRRGRAILRGVPVELVRRFIRAYEFQEMHEDLREDLLLRYIDAEVLAGSLARWNIGIVSREDAVSALGAVDLALGAPVPCINRSRYRTTRPCNIKALTSRADRVVDLEGGDADEETLIALRNREAPRTGLLLLYPISKDSVPERGEERTCPACHAKHRIDGEPVRHPLLAAEHMLGVALVFPRTLRSEGTYVANNLAAVLQPDDDIQEVPEEELDR